MYRLLRPLLFRIGPGRAHASSLTLLRAAGALAPVRSLLRTIYAFRDAAPVQALGLTFPNPIGLAAGYDKDALAWRGLACLGFGHLEIGTVTPRPQPGNPHPRLFRLPEDRALINRMGSPSRGAAYVARRLAGRRPGGVVIGVNLGKQTDTPLQDAAEDYRRSMETLAPVADYLAVNVSSPNTPELRRLQSRELLASLLSELDRTRRELQTRLRRRLPLLIKLSPDLTDDELDEALEVILGASGDGVIATNTSIRREGLRSRLAHEAGGLSGAPLLKRSTAMIRAIHRRAGGALPIIGVGGVASADDARAMFDAGATLVQLYTSLVYEGPGLVKRILRRL